MATLEDKILGEKLEYYCSSDEENESSDDNDEYDDAVSNPAEFASVSQSFHKTDTSSSNTGPKGVMKDWQRYKQLETEKRKEDEKERLALVKKFSITCASTLDEEDPELADLLSDDVLMELTRKRMEELFASNGHQKKFGHLVHLKSGEEYLDALDKEVKTATVILHVYEDHSKSCRTMNACLDELSRSYPSVKFCKMAASTAGLSHNFKTEGVPALLIYKAGDLVGNFVKLQEEFGSEFTPNDVENFLIDKGIALSYSNTI